MAQEIERKFLVKQDRLPREFFETQSKLLNQGYLSLSKFRQVRIRTLETFDQLLQGIGTAYITVKGKSKGITRTEYEYEVPFQDALGMLDLVEGSIITKNRTCFGRWEVDFFLGDNEGLLVAEIELTSEDEQIELPEWVGEEVSTDPRYSNINLAQHPYKEW